ncbi:hypothetical protein [Limnospira maxima]|uniref:hypothetical protein n=1 Tax=Limnospira maxima TaxID=129910 RepID=UPI00135F114E|nr:hypothetical protein [Limnospira maxima]
MTFGFPFLANVENELRPRHLPPQPFIVGWVERSLYTKHSDSSRLAGAIALHNTVGL